MSYSSKTFFLGKGRFIGSFNGCTMYASDVGEYTVYRRGLKKYTFKSFAQARRYCFLF